MNKEQPKTPQTPKPTVRKYADARARRERENADAIRTIKAGKTASG